MISDKLKTIFLFPTVEEAAPLLALQPSVPVRITGVGMAAAAAATARIIFEECPDRLVLAGIAGASDRSLEIGEVVAVRTERIAELPAAYDVRHEASWLPGGLRVVDSNTVSRVGVIAPATPIENMEGAAFMAVCRALGVACAEIRAISNYTDDPRSAWRIEEATANLAKIIVHF